MNCSDENTTSNNLIVDMPNDDIFPFFITVIFEKRLSPIVTHMCE